MVLFVFKKLKKLIGFLQELPRFHSACFGPGPVLFPILARISETSSFTLHSLESDAPQVLEIRDSDLQFGLFIFPVSPFHIKPMIIRV